MSAASQAASASAASLLGSTQPPPQPAEQWGNPAFRGCRACRRPRTAPNPFGDHESRPCLAFKSDRHNFCLVCVGVFKKKDPELMSNTDKRTKYVKELGENEEAYEGHKRDVERYEASRIESYAKRRKTGKPLPENPELEDEDIQVKTAQERVVIPNQESIT